MTAELSFPIRLIGHIGIPGAAPFVAMGLFFAGMGGVVGRIDSSGHGST